MLRALALVALLAAVCLEALRRSPDLAARLFAWAHARSDTYLDRRYGAEKRRLLSDLSGTVLELGPGTGGNLRYLPTGLRWIGVEPNIHMHPVLLSRAADLDLDARVVLGAGESLDVPSASVDAVVCTLVLCSVRDQAAVLAEVRRVLRPGGRFVFLEHVAAPRGSWLRWLQSFVAPVWSICGHGCRPDRETWRALEAAGFRRLDCRRFEMDGLPLVAPHIAGVAEA